MRSSVDALERDIREMRTMASAIKPANDLLAKSVDPAVKAYLSVRRRFDYSALIVALYASFEGFIEDLLASYVTTLVGRSKYGDLPEQLTGKHLQKTAELLAKGKVDALRYPGASSFQLVENLYHCLSGKSPYELNHVAVVAHDRNIRYDELGALLRLVDLSPDAIRRARPLIDWYCDDQKLTGKAPESVPATVVQRRLDNFVDRRNDVAHRGGNPADRLGVDEMQGLVEFIVALANSIFVLFVSEYLRKQRVGVAGCEQLTLIEGPFKKQCCWVVKRPATRLHVKQPAFALSSSFLVRWGRVQSLQIDGTDHAAIEPDGDEAVGILLDFAAPTSADVYVLAMEDQAIWPALSDME